MNKRNIAIALIFVGAALLLGSAIFILDSLTATEPAGLGQWIFNVLGSLLGAGVSIKGWMDLKSKETDIKAGQRIQNAVDSPSSEQRMEGRGGIQKQESVRSKGSKQTMK